MSTGLNFVDVSRVEARERGDARLRSRIRELGDEIVLLKTRLTDARERHIKKVKQMQARIEELEKYARLSPGQPVKAGGE